MDGKLLHEEPVPTGNLHYNYIVNFDVSVQCIMSSAILPGHGTFVSVLFSGTLRLNLDPTERFTDDQLIKVLKLSHLDKFVSASAGARQHSVLISAISMALISAIDI